MKRIVFFVYIFLICSISTFAQSQGFSLKGKVRDNVTKLPLKNVSISVDGTLSGTISDSTGAFSLYIPVNAIRLQFSILGYEKKFIKISPESTAELVIELTKKITDLNEVTINAPAVEIIHKHKRYNVLDYEFYGDNILLITYVDLDKAKLVLINQNSDTLGIKRIPSEPNRLFKDCLGNIHVVCHDSIYQAYYNENKLQLLTSKSIGDFEKILLPCVAQDSSNFYLETKAGTHMVNDFFKSVKSNSYIVNYTSINKKSRQRLNFAMIVDEKTINQQAEEKSRQDYKVQLAKKYKYRYNRWAENLFVETLVFTEVYAPLYNINNSIYIFDCINNNIQCYDKLCQLKKTIPIDFHKNLQFTREMQIDPKTLKAFAVFESNGISELKEINLNTGRVNASCKIPFVFVNHIKVYDNYIYFIRKGKEYDETRYLSRLKMN
ncbi:MAG: carboxypeptidase-like regulatory domain-containing protein [Bacteroidota bacterium]